MAGQKWAVYGLLIGLSGVSWATDLPRAEPESQGVSSAGVLAFVNALDQVEVPNSFMLVRHGHVVAEGWWAPYRSTSRHSLYSLSKSFTSTAVGLAIAEGKLHLHDEVLPFFPGEGPAAPSEQLKAMRVSDLLRMATGHQTEPPRTAEEPWTKTFLNHPVPFKPGTHFLYNTSATYMQSAIVQKATGLTVLDYLRPRLFEPLGIEGPTWEASPQGISTGGYGLSIRTEDIAKFGQLYLQHGQWHGQTLVPADWIAAATSLQTANGSNPASDWDQGYGYQFWRCRHDAYRGDGAFGQFCVVLPERDAVVVITSGVRDMQLVLNLVWDKLLPAIMAEKLAPDPERVAALHQKLRGLSIRKPLNQAAQCPGMGSTYEFPDNELKVKSLSVEPPTAGQSPMLVVKTAEGEQRIPCGNEGWTDRVIALGKFPAQPAASVSGWTSDTLTTQICFYETPYIVTWKLQFSEDMVQLHAETNVGFGELKGIDLTGMLHK